MWALEQVSPSMARRVQDGAVLMVDGAMAYKKVAKERITPQAAPRLDVRHSRPKPQLTRFHKFPFRDMSNRLKQVMKQQGRHKPNSSSIRFQCGTQAVDGRWGNLKDNLRSQKAFGKGKEGEATLRSLASTFNLVTPGLEAYAKAFRKYSEYWIPQAEPKGFFDPCRILA